LKAC